MCSDFFTRAPCSDLPDGLRDRINRGSFRGAASDYDVITLVKKYISSANLGQASH